jgi:ferredoxin-NADP reductase/predicted pyridoxine 5'-phosphate oxidase superfamily flavin-nucleotide-binding protein
MATVTQTTSPWHEGEITLQRRAGVAERMAEIGPRVLRDHLVQQHRDFYPQLPFVVLGAVDPAGDAWATLRAGKPGFLSAPGTQYLHVAVPPDLDDPAEAGMADGAALGLLGIELHTRRRNRLNGQVRRTDAGFDLLVGQSYGNCPQYIQLRQFAFVRNPDLPATEPPRRLEALDDRARAMIQEADSFFVASYVDRADTGRQVDVSHRGGKPGFVRIGADGVLTVPDFAGNLFFNTLGNFLVNPKAGLVFADFATGDLLQLSGEAEVVLDSPEIAAFQGAERLWRFTPRRILLRPAALPLRWRFVEGGESPSALLTGNWDEAADRLQAQDLATTWRVFRIARVVEESASVRSFHLAPVDGRGIIPHQAGQHLPIRVALPGTGVQAQRSYTLSTAPSDGVYRISVKRDGPVSHHLHGLKRGDVIEARAPAGGFTFDAAEPRPAVLLAAGIGVTPMIAMLRHAVYEGMRTRRLRPIWFFQSARTKAERAFDAEIASLVDSAQGAIHLVRVLSDPDGSVEGRDYDAAGRIDLDLLRATLPFDDYDFYLCGPPGFMQGLYDQLRRLNVADTRIHAEAFGPGSFTRTPDPGAPARPRTPPAETPVPVVFSGSGKEARWTPEAGSLLQLAESRGLAPPFSCRAGSCGSCRTRILDGAVAYATPPSAETLPDEALICCAVPAAPADGEPGRLVLDL